MMKDTQDEGEEIAALRTQVRFCRYQNGDGDAGVQMASGVSVVPVVCDDAAYIAPADGIMMMLATKMDLGL